MRTHMPMAPRLNSGEPAGAVIQTEDGSAAAGGGAGRRAEEVAAGGAAVVADAAAVGEDLAGQHEVGGVEVPGAAAGRRPDAAAAAAGQHGQGHAVVDLAGAGAPARPAVA